MSRQVVITSTFLRPGDDVDRRLQAAGWDVVHASPEERARRHETLANSLEYADAVIGGTDAFDAATLRQARQLKLIVRTGVGYDNVDIATATKCGIAVCTTPGANRQSVAEHVLALMLNGARSIPQNMADVQAGEWKQPSGRELNGSTLGLIGLGSIGKTVAELALAFGMNVIATDPYIDTDFTSRTGVRGVSLDELLSSSDFVSCHLFLDETTYHLLNADRLNQMKSGSYLINTSRGPVIDEVALARAVLDGRISGAALDVLEEEPLSPDSPLKGLRNVSITSHIAGATLQARQRSGQVAAECVISTFEAGHLTGLVNPGYSSANSGASRA